MEEFPPDPLLLPGSVGETCRHHGHRGIQRTDDLDIVADVIRLDRSERFCDPCIIVSTPAWPLPPADIHVRFRIHLLDRFSCPSAERRKRDVHPFLEVGPCGKIVALALHRFVGCGRGNRIPSSRTPPPTLYSVPPKFRTWTEASGAWARAIDRRNRSPRTQQDRQCHSHPQGCKRGACTVNCASLNLTSRS